MNAPPARAAIVRQRPPAARARFAAADLAIAASLAAAFCCAALLPQRWWSRAARLAAGNARDDRARAAAHKFELRIQNWGAVLGRWRPRIAIEGGVAIEAALAHQGGAVLWVVHSAFNSNALKRALHARGWPLHHVSRPEHGFSKTRFGIRWLNPLRTRAEDRDLASRIVIAAHDARGAMRTALRILRARGGLVSVTAGAWEGVKLVRVPFDGDRDIVLASGAASLARAAGVPLLPVIVRRDGDDQDFTVVCGTAIRVDGPGDEALVAACRDYARLVARFAAGHPDQWRGWDRLLPAAAAFD